MKFFQNINNDKAYHCHKNSKNDKFSVKNGMLNCCFSDSSIIAFLTDLAIFRAMLGRK